MHYKEELFQKIASKSAGVGVIGLGYVGLPLAIVFDEADFKVIGFDLDPKGPEALNHGNILICVPTPLARAGGAHSG